MRIIPCIAFQAYPINARDVLNFYKKCFGGDVIVDEQTLEFHLRINGKLVLTTINRGPGYSELKYIGRPFSLSIECESEQELRSYFTALSEGGEIDEPIQWSSPGRLFALIEDKFKILWELTFKPI